MLVASFVPCMQVCTGRPMMLDGDLIASINGDLMLDLRPLLTPAACRRCFEAFGSLKSATKAAQENKAEFDFDGRFIAPEKPGGQYTKAKEHGSTVNLQLLYFAFDILAADGEVRA